MSIKLFLASIVGLVYALQAATGLAIPQDSVSKRIVNGFYMPNAFAPYAVYLTNRYGATGMSVCGGTIISPDYVLTAGHCVISGGKYLPASNITISYGSQDSSKQTKATTLKVTAHPKFLINGKMDLAYDLALVKIKTISLSTNTARVPIYAGAIDAGQNLMAMGWGITQADSLSQILQGVVVTTGDVATCKASNSEFQSQNGPQLCTLTKLTPGQSTCVGDSGTSVVISQGSTQYLAGSVSFSVIPNGGACNSDDGVRYFIHPHYYIEFIAATTGLTQAYLTGTATSSSGNGAKELEADLSNKSNNVVIVTETVYHTPVFSYS
ncbi:hypothetical protein IW140_005823 [Coemansia sp. RSA 1813]|nr:hypothetical protein EV178_003910 [Coemansia sp. RSA 1646]KAJ1770457.1 hypothetical protein LPJ74_003192 [Coemansia sp. RSA 1843]KAJ2090248.1 hypothetical protein IW138_002880 [Coemansia sp. RSA 986]KAJ2212585.1 hypothetical protein EV179_004567 [Coemansia sp. RSA 487]KAJ2564265.1 hypothetical protein IW140_005823 [Coemansia sp. RSA 1813]